MAERRGGGAIAPGFVLPPPLRATRLGARFPAHLFDSGLIRPGQSVLVALSGGADSVVLLHLLCQLRQAWGLRLEAAHFDHRMRPGSEADARWVSGLCRALGVALELGVAEGALAGEAEARRARYRFLSEVARRRAVDRIATAHHADDQAETVLFRIARGTGLRGLGGIPPRRGRIVRPLLPFRRAEILSYAAAAHLRFREDPTNLSPSYARNRIRLEVLPRLEKVAPGAVRSLVRLSALAREEMAAWDAVLDELEGEVVVGRADGRIELARPRLLSYHPRVRIRLLRRMLEQLGSVPGRGGTEEVLEFITSGTSGSHIRVAGGVRIEREFDRLRLYRVVTGEAPAEARPLLIPAAGEGTGEAVIGGRRLTVRWTVGRDGAAMEAFDPAALRFPLELRGWRPGDRIALPYGSKKLKKLFVERRLGRAERARTPILAEVGGRVLWVVGVARAAVAEPGAAGPPFRITVMDAE
jgi:tRNA(Ile)-lysidine synthase